MGCTVAVHPTYCVSCTRDSRDLIFLFIPCDLVLPRAGFACKRRDAKTKLDNILSVEMIHKFDKIPLVFKHIPRKYHKDYSVLFLQCEDLTYLLQYHVCDGIPSCPNGEDEENCTAICSLASQGDCFHTCHVSNCTCNPLYFQCESGGCIPSSKLCDGLDDCPDSSDESALLCVITFPPKVQSNQTHKLFHKQKYCKIAAYGYKLAVPILEICNQKEMCNDGIDEWFYDCTKFTPFYGLRCPRDNMLLTLGDITYGRARCKLSQDGEIAFHFHTNLPAYCDSKGFAVKCTGITNAVQIKTHTKSVVLINSNLNK